MKRQARSGFTIVELLIVIIVIAILAAITLVAFSNVTNRAKAAAASSAAQQAVKKVLVYMTTNADQVPPDLAAAGITASGGTTYQYRSDATVSPQTFCITATSNSVSYFVNNTTQTTPKAGACPGHGVDGGGTITNLATNPNATSLTGFGGNGAPGVNSILSDGGFSGATYVRRVFSGTGTNGAYFTPAPATVTIAAGKTYTVSAWVRTSKAMTIRAGIDWKTSTGSYIAGMSGAPVTTGSSSWTRISATGTAPAGTQMLSFIFFNAASSWAASDWEDVDALVITEGSSVYTFADGSSPGWAWNGDPNNSTSTGPGR